MGAMGCCEHDTNTHAATKDTIKEQPGSIVAIEAITAVDNKPSEEEAQPEPKETQIEAEQPAEESEDVYIKKEAVPEVPEKAPVPSKAYFKA